ncbi:hypothetical protein GWK47_003310 [Chionoecetes opilio]|uniref:Uncharacterized protein n=1 Tax=Chionoecetes opilio TaxID=41210 RepID=A0A8J4YKY7_CHIOP|nr:hypothetical protein GWK47_003310 [Chionoecetes opilio]
MKDENRVVLLYWFSIILDGCFLLSPSATLSDVGEWTRWTDSALPGLQRWQRRRGGAPREVNLTLSAAAATSFVIFSLFGREAEAAALPRAEELVSDEEVMNQHIQQWRNSRSPTQSSSLLQSLC